MPPPWPSPPCLPTAEDNINVFFSPANVEIMKMVVPTFLKQELPAKPSFSF